MQIANGTTIAVADGAKLKMFRNVGDERSLELEAVSAPDVPAENSGSGAGHHSSAANPDESQAQEDGFASGIADMLNKQVLAGAISNLVIIAAPKTLGELRKNYHKKTSEAIIGEISKDLTGHPLADIEKAISAKK